MTNNEVREIALRAAGLLGLRKIPRFSGRWNKSRGWARRQSGTFSLPRWLKDEPRAHQVQYVVHEVTHHHPEARGHNDVFLRLETKVLEAFGIVPEYARVYPKVLWSLDGELLWSKAQQMVEQYADDPSYGGSEHVIDFARRRWPKDPYWTKLDAA